MTLASTLVLTSLSIAAPSAEDATARALDGLELSMDIQLVDAGAEPRQVLKFQPKPGSSVDVEFVNTQKMDMEMIGPDGTAMPMGGMGDMAPTMIMGMRQEVGQPLPNGLLPVTIRYTEMSVTNVEPQMQQMMLAGIKPLEGTSFRMLFNGKTGGIEQVDVDSESSDQLYQALQGMADGFMKNMAQFPEEPVGKGAKWTVDMDMGIAGMQLGATNKVTLTKVQGNMVEMAFEMEMQRGDGPMQLPGLPPGAEVDFTKFEATGSGTNQVDLTTMATMGTSQTAIDMGVKVVAEGQTMQMNMKMDQKTEVRPKK